MAAGGGYERYLLDGERVVVAMHQHWAKVAGPVALVVVGLVVAITVDATVPETFGAVATVVWWLWFATLLYAAWQLVTWRHDWFVATDKRLLLTYGFVARRVAMMPLTKVTDMSYQRSVPGRLVGYGEFILESAGQEQALRDVRWIPDPDETYRAICAEIFGVDDVPRARALASDGDPVVEPVEWGEPWVSEGSDTPAPYAAPSPIEEYGPHSRAIPVQTATPRSAVEPAHHEQPGVESLYQSEDLRQGGRTADTGPLPRYPTDD